MDLNFYSKTIYRDDIQGVRALGALIIMIYHIWINKVSGGVDIFFVISGYFMAGMLIRSYIKNGNLLPFEFWSRILRKIAPLSFIVILTTIILGYFFIPPYLWPTTINQAIASALNIENIQLIRTGTDYLASDVPPTPFQQFWALSIQIQFYFILPLIFLLGIKNKNGKNLLYIIPLLIFLSFIFSILYTNNNPSNSYFNTISRLWEFLCGVFIFLLLPFIKLSERLSKLFMFFGFLLIFLMGVIVPKEMNYPGYISLLPVISAGLLIISGNFHKKGLIYKILSSKQMVYLGGLSFSIYLWHWPILIFYKQHIGIDSKIGFIPGCFIIILSIILSILSKKFIENPFSRMKSSKLYFPYVYYFLFILLLITPSLYIKKLFSDIDRDSFINSYKFTNTYKGKSVYIEDNPKDIPLKNFTSVLLDRSISSKPGCSDGVVNGKVSFCILGDKSSKISILLIGGSRLAHWEPIFSYYGQKNGVKVIVATTHSCSVGVNIRQLDKCAEWNKEIFNFIENIDPKPKLLIMNSSRNEHDKSIHQFKTPKGEYIPEEYINSIKRILSLDIPVLGIRINPIYDNPNYCLWKNKDNISNCYISADKYLLEKNPAIELKNKLESEGFTGFHPVDFTDVMCENNKCPLSFNGYLTMTDFIHFTRSYISYLSPLLLDTTNSQTDNLLDEIKK